MQAKLKSQDDGYDRGKMMAIFRTRMQASMKAKLMNNNSDEC